MKKTKVNYGTQEISLWDFTIDENSELKVAQLSERAKN
jgi:hypothetical protein